MERYDFRTRRLFLDEEMEAGRTIGIERAQANYLLNVLRLKAGDRVLVFNGRSGEWLAEIVPEGRKACALVLRERTREQPPAPDLVYCFAPLKHARLDYMAQKAVEMGAGVLQPVVTRHTQVAAPNLDRMRANAIEAAEQCGILSIPEIREPTGLARMLEQWPRERTLVFCDESAADASLADLLPPLAGRPLGVLIGPEGGFSSDERQALAACDFVTPIPLGPRILRADTAAVAALAVVQALAGDWRPGAGETPAA